MTGEKRNSRKRVIYGWVAITVIALLFMVYGVLSLELRVTETHTAENELTMPTEPLADYVYLIIVDGLRVDGMDEMPYVSEMASNGGYGIMQVEEPTYSRPAYARIITGASSSINGINGNFQTWKLSLPTIYDIAVNNGLKTGASAYHWFYELTSDSSYRTGSEHENRIINDADLPIQHGYYYDDFNFVYDDEEIFSQGKKIMLEHAPNLLIVHSMEVDQFGHESGGISEEYRDAVRRNDLYIRDFVEAIPHPEDSIVIVTGDHGHIDIGGHGGPEKEAVKVPLTISGKNVLNEQADGYMQLDLAPTLCALLGVPFSAYMEGAVMEEPFDWPAGTFEQKNSLLAGVHRPFVTSMYDRYDVAYSEEEEISIAGLHDIVHNRVVQSRLNVSLVILGVVLIVLLVTLKLYSVNNVKRLCRGNGLLLVSALVSTAVYIIVYRLAFSFLHLSYSYSIIDPSVGFVFRFILPPVIAFGFFYLSYTVWMKGGKGDFKAYAVHTQLLILVFLAVMGVSFVLQGGEEIFLPDFRWYLVYVFTAFHLFLYGIMCIIFSRFANKRASFGKEKAAESA